MEATTDYIGVRLPKAHVTTLKRVAAANDLTVSQIMRALVKEWAASRTAST